MISGLVANGLSDIDNQYFILLFNFGAVDFSNIYVIFGLGTLIVQARWQGARLCRSCLRPCAPLHVTQPFQPLPPPRWR